MVHEPFLLDACIRMISYHEEYGITGACGSQNEIIF